MQHGQAFPDMCGLGFESIASDASCVLQLAANMTARPPRHRSPSTQMQMGMRTAQIGEGGRGPVCPRLFLCLCLSHSGVLVRGPGGCSHDNFFRQHYIITTTATKFQPQFHHYTTTKFQSAVVMGYAAADDDLDQDAVTGGMVVYAVPVGVREKQGEAVMAVEVGQGGLLRVWRSGL
eukprot:614971-Rhodomonas_salina.1